MYNHVINTKVGKFHFGWANSSSKWIAGKFEEPVKAKEIYTCNPYSGKHNFLGIIDPPLNELMDFLHDLKSHGILISKEVKGYKIKYNMYIKKSSSVTICYYAQSYEQIVQHLKDATCFIEIIIKISLGGRK